MAFEDLKDQLTERAQATWGQIQESSLYIQLNEKYADLNPTSQKIVLAVGSLLLVLFTLMIPWSYISSSSTSMETFEENKTILRELFRVSRASAELEGAPPQIDPGALMGQAQGQLQGMNIQAEQIRSVNQIDNFSSQQGAPNLPGVPKAVEQKGIEVALNKLNLRQVVEIGYSLMTLQPGLKMTGLTVTAATDDPHYFNATYRIISFSMPTPPEEKPAPGARRNTAPRRNNNNNDNADAESEE